MKFGVLALQGDFREHIQTLARLGIKADEVRSIEELQALDALIIPGGESTTMSLLAKSTGLDEAIREKLAGGMFVYGSCAGMILLATEILDGRADQISFGAIDMSVRRNGFGRQVDSFETQLNSSVFPQLHGIFIRAPKIEKLGQQVEVLATLTRSGEQTPVLVRSGRAIASSFHPELGLESPVHRYFIDLVTGKIS